MKSGARGVWGTLVVALAVFSACSGGEATTDSQPPASDQEVADTISDPESEDGLPPPEEIGTVPTIVEGTDDRVDVSDPSSVTSLPETTTTSTTTTVTTTTLPTTTTTLEPCQPPIPSDVLFDTNSAELREEADEQLATAAETLLEDCPASKIVVVGHTDSRGTEQYNLDLSLQRAQAVIDWMVQFGIDRSTFEAQGAGESDLLEQDVGSDGTFDENAGARNRRVEFRVFS